MKAKFSIKSKIDKGEVKDKLKKVLFDSMLKLQEISVTTVPVDTGRLKNSIILNPQSPGNKKYTVATGTHYASHVEFGTIYQDAQPYLRPAFFQVKNIWVKRYMQKAFKK